MATRVFINLPVKDLDKSVSFFTALGYRFNPQFTDENATCMIISDNIFVMLLTETYFKTFTKKQVADAKTTTEVLISLDTTSREEVQKMVANAKESGATVYAEPQDHGWMYQHSFADLDGHQWELVYIDENQLPNQE
ncbi:VOC family protein [Chitinophaga sp. XS-30]|uniref:VOC family protein n=1 Tax=Chitinophaga sp. XS-30 TaxID=2604421 RepID=UPI0011DCA58F|nr:VOC family protein [Chitinophaga sp. XS-30]QEH41924.1 glyoxalase/bleomycin resistance/extradiol dioxygenase family protein [Chitinophaga sp. XS-30]